MNQSGCSYQHQFWLLISCVILLIFIVWIPLVAHSQSTSGELTTFLKNEKTKLSKRLDKLDLSISALEKVDTPDTSQKNELASLFQARDFTQKGLDTIIRTEEFYQAYQGVPSRLKKLEKELASPLPTELKVNPKETLATLEQKLETARADLETARKIRSEIETESAQRSERLLRIADDSSIARKKQEELTQLLAAPLANGDKENAARQIAAQAEQDYLTLFLLQLEQEQRSYENRRELLRARRQQAERQVLITLQRFNALEEQVNHLRITAAAQAMQAADSAILESTSAHPLVRDIVDTNQKLAAELTQISSINTILSEEKKELEEKLSRLNRQYEGIKDKINQIGLTDAIGLKLRADRNQLPDRASFISTLNRHTDEINRVQLRRIEIEDRLLELINLKRETQRLIANSKDTLSETEIETLGKIIENALAEQRDKYLSELIKIYDIHFEKHLFPIMESERQLISLIEEYNEFIDTRVLWIQSAPTLEISGLKQLGAAAHWMVNLQSVTHIFEIIINDFIDNPLLNGFVLVLIALLFVNYKKLREKLSESGRYVTKLSKAKFSDTLQAAFLTALMVLPWPFLIFFIAWRIELSGFENTYAIALSSGFIIVAYLLFLGLLLRRICRPNGLGEAHFRWKVDSLNLVRRQLSWFLPVSLPLAFIVVSTLNQPTQAHHDSLGRFSFIFLMFASSLFIYKLFKPSSGILKNDIVKHPGGWLDRLSSVWFPMLILSPIGLAIAAVIGYFYTAIQLCLYIIGTIGFIFVIYVVREFFIRWLSITQRKLALEQWRKKLEAQSEASDKNEKQDATEQTPIEEPELDVETLSVQTMRLLNSAYWITIILGTALIWSEVLPALKLLNEIVLWNSEITSDSGTSIVPTTLANVLLAATILLMTLFISRNIPGLLEIAILQHLPFTPSGRYAITTITRYLLVIIGLAMTFNAIGIGWSKVQWLAAAITVGLGFGLQEIFANFVSGLIMLFERQIRVGDIVTVGNTSGKVTRIMTRATTITDWDRKELIIPNKEFVTGQVINWSLSDMILRIVIPVGIAYGSDTKLAHEILLTVAQDNHNVLGDPEPSVRFVMFGESSLDFELRVFIPNPELLLETKHELHMEIDQRFRDAKIEIAFPQRDIHIKNYSKLIANKN